MARTGVTYEQVAAAADQQLSTGRQPTISSVREALGTGSPNTVHKHLTVWKSARPQTVSAVRELPSKILDAINAEIEQATAAARAEVETQLVQSQSETADLAAAGEILEDERDALAESVVALTTERDTVAGKNTEQAAEIIRLVAEIERERNSAENARIEVAQARLKIESQAADIVRLAADASRLQADLAKETNARVDAEKSAAVLTAKFEAATNRADAAEKRADTVAAQVEAERKVSDQVRADGKKSAEESAELRGKISALTAQIEALKQVKPAAKPAPVAPKNSPKTK